ncbi:hypothetical protein BVX98_03535, partial [bacterium F11]
MLRFDRLTYKAQESLEKAVTIAKENFHQEIDVDHLFLGLLSIPDSLVITLLNKINVNIIAFKKDIEALIQGKPQIKGSNLQEHISQHLQNILEQAEKESQKMGDQYISVEHIFLALIKEPQSSLIEILAKHGLHKEGIEKVLKDVRGAHQVTDQNPEGKYQSLEKYGKDL